MEFSRQEYWSGLPFPSPGDLPNPGIEPGSLELQAESLLSEPPGKSRFNVIPIKISMAFFFFFTEIAKHAKICMKPKRPQIVNLEKEEQNWRHHTS